MALQRLRLPAAADGIAVGNGGGEGATAQHEGVGLGGEIGVIATGIVYCKENLLHFGMLSLWSFWSAHTQSLKLPHVTPSLLLLLSLVRAVGCVF